MANNTRGQVRTDNWDYNAAPSRAIGTNLFNSEYQNVSTTDVAGGFPPLKLGTQFNTYDGRVFRYIESVGQSGFNLDLAEGDLLVPTASFALTAIAVSATDSTILTATSTSQVYANQFRGGYLFLSSATGIGQTRRVVANSAAAASGTVTIYLDRAFTTAPASSPAGMLWHPYRMIQLPNAAVIGDAISGISYGTITQPASATPFYAGGRSYYGWMQVAGFCEYVKLTGNLVVPVDTRSALLTVSATAGKAQIVTTGATADKLAAFGIVPRPVGLGAVTSPGGTPAVLFACQG